MIIGVPKEVKENEGRVALLPFGVNALKKAGHSVLVQKNAGIGAGIADSDFQDEGAQIVENPQEIFAKSDLILKVKEPQPQEISMLRRGQIVFTYFHFAADETMTKAVQNSGCIAVAYETLTDVDGSLPLLVPMSEIAGRMSIQEGAKYLEKPQGGRGVLLSGANGVDPGRVLILGGGIVGANAAKVAAGMGAQVTIVDSNLARIRYLNSVMPPNVVSLYSSHSAIQEKLPISDLVIGAVLLPGAKAPKLVKRQDLKLMLPGSVIVDVAIDQGGCFETSRPTTHSNPVFIEEGVVHYCVGNMPGGVARTSTFALCNATFAWAFMIAQKGIEKAAIESAPLASGINMYNGDIVNKEVAETFNLPYVELKTILCAH